MFLSGQEMSIATSFDAVHDLIIGQLHPITWQLCQVVVHSTSRPPRYPKLRHTKTHGTQVKWSPAKSITRSVHP